MALNKVILVGRIASDIELKKTQTGIPVVRFSLALNKGEGKADFFNLTAWEKQAEFLASYFRKGDGICVDGHLSARPYEVDGQRRTYFEVVCDHLSFAEGRRKDEGGIDTTPDNNVAENGSQSLTEPRYTQMSELEEYDPDDPLPF